MIALALLLFAGALVASFFGLGGGILYTPFQVWLGVPLNQAVSTSLFLILATSLSATFVFGKKGRVDFLFALVMEIPTTAGAFLGGVFSHYFPEEITGALLVLAILMASVLMLRPPREMSSFCSPSRVKSSAFHWRREWLGQEHFLDLRCIFPLMFFVGFYLSLVGISGGIIKIPIMVLLLGVPMPIAVGSSAFMVGLTATAGFLGHLSVGHVNWKHLLILLIPVFLGAQIGSRLSAGIKGERMERLYGWFLLLVAVITFLKLFLL